MGHDYGNVPSESSVLCEGCGYTLDGLAPSGKCPECGLDIVQSRESDGRTVPAWEDTASHRWVCSRFWRTTFHIISRPGHFYRTLATRRADRRAQLFAQLHWVISAILLGGALSIHAYWYETSLSGPAAWLRFVLYCSAPAVYLFTWITTALAARLTTWEARYRDIRLPLPVVLRGMYYHAAHYLPVGLIALATTGINLLLVRAGNLWMDATLYLYVLCGEVIVAALYLFKTYWIAMKAMMYANR